MMRARLLLALLLLAPGVAHAQSLFSTHGLGVPLEGVDARGRALGVNGVGLLGLSTALLNPAEHGGMLRRGITATFQPWSANVELNGSEGEIGGTRFPLIAALYPVRRFTFTLGYAGLLDQSWAVFAEGRQPVGSDSVATLDLVRSVGGIGQLRFGAAYVINPHWSIGAAVGLHTGSVARTVTREFPDTALGLRPFETRSSWDYSGPLASVGLRWDAGRDVRAGASITWSGTLDAEPKEGSTDALSYDMPLRLAAGISARVSSRLMVAASATLSDYDGSAAYLAPGTSTPVVADRSLEVGGGIEWADLRSGDRIFPLRVGFRRVELPFHNVDEERATEWSITGGIGFRLVEDDFGPLAVADVGVERGRRDGWRGPVATDGLRESFWRFTVSVSLFGR